MKLKIKKRSLPKWAGFIFICLLVSFKEVPDAPTKPDILMILVDDFGSNDLSIKGARDIHTPHLDKLFQQGLSDQMMGGKYIHDIPG